MADYNPWIQEWVSINDEEEELVPILLIDISDSITITESFGPNLICNLNLNDALSITEDTANLLPILFLNVNDSPSITESFSGLIPVLKISIINSVSITDDEIEFFPALSVNISDSIVITEYFIEQRIDLGDSIIISESIILGLPVLFLSKSDSVSITDEDIYYLFPLQVFDNVYIRDLFTKAIADAGIEGIYNTIAVTQSLFASAIRTAGTYLSESFKIRSAIYLRFHIDVTAENGTATLDAILQTSPDNSVWYDAVTMDQISATGQYSEVMTEPGIYVRIKCVISGSGSPSFTFDSKLTKYMPVGPRRHTYITRIRK